MTRLPETGLEGKPNYFVASFVGNGIDADGEVKLRMARMARIVLDRMAGLAGVYKGRQNGSANGARYPSLGQRPRTVADVDKG